MATNPQALQQNSLARLTGTQMTMLVLLSVGHAFTDVNQGAIPALLPVLKDAYGLSYAAVGSILMVANVASSVIQPAFGLMSDAARQSWLMPAGVLAAATGLAMTGFGHSYYAILAATALCGLGVAAFHPEASRAAHHIAGWRRAAGMAVYSVGGNLGFALGPPFVIGLITAFGPRGTGFALFPGLVMAAVLLALLPRLNAAEDEAKAQVDPGITENLPSLWGAEVLLIVLVTVRSWIQLGLASFYPFYYIAYQGGSKADTGLLLFTFLASGALGTVFGSPLADRIGTRAFLILSLTVVLPAQALLLVSHGWQTLALLFIAGFALVSSFSVTLLMSQEFLPRYVGVASGLNIGFSIGMGGIGVTLLGVFADRWGIGATLQSMLVLTPVAILLAWLLPDPRRRALAGAAAKA